MASNFAEGRASAGSCGFSTGRMLVDPNGKIPVLQTSAIE